MIDREKRQWVLAIAFSILVLATIASAFILQAYTWLLFSLAAVTYIVLVAHGILTRDKRDKKVGG